VCPPRSLPELSQTHTDYNESIYAKGASRRIYGDLYQAVDPSDVVLHVLDARNPLGTMCDSVLEYIKKEKVHKLVVLIINKCDLVPNCAAAWHIQHLAPQFPTITFHASTNCSLGKGSLIQLLRQLPQPHSDKSRSPLGPERGGKQRDQHAQKREGDVVRVEALPTPSDHIPELMERLKPLYLARTYGMPLPDEDDPTCGWAAEASLDALARMKGRLLKSGEPDLEGVSKVVLSDWVRGRIPFFMPPPERSEELNKNMFVREDVRPLEEEEGREEEGGGEGSNGEDVVEERAQEEEPLTRNDVFAEGCDHPTAARGQADGEESEEEEEQQGLGAKAQTAEAWGDGLDAPAQKG
ncbi:hypothetical protein OF83DRAFT_1179037, partial [Amylostereum chailletii]